MEVKVLVNENDEVDYEKELLGVASEIGIDTTKRIDSHYDTVISEL